VSSHDTRSYQQNRKIARQLLQLRLDLHYNKDKSFLEKEAKEKRLEKLKNNKKAINKLKLKQEFKKSIEIEKSKETETKKEKE
jgi:peptide chain release factor